MITETPIVFFDTETTGILKDESWEITSNWALIQLAYRKNDNWNLTDKNIFVNTDVNIEIWSMTVHGIYKDLLIEKSNNKYLEDDLRLELNPIFTDNIIVAHNLDFDLDVLKKSNIETWDKMIDTLKVAKILWSEWYLVNEDDLLPEYVNLQYLRYFFKLYKITDSDGNEEITTAHDAFWDVVVLENVFYKLFDIIKTNLNISDDEVIKIMMKMTQKKYTLIEIMRIGKYRWKSFEEVAEIDPSYLKWMVWADFSGDIKYTCKVWLWMIEDEKFMIKS